MGHAQSPDSSVSAPSEAAPAYDHLFEQQPSNPITGYSHIPTTDQNHDIEHHGHGHDHEHEHSHNHNHNHHHNHELAAFLPTENFNDPPPAPFRDSMTQSTQPHFHCEVCDARQERRERRNGEQRCCLVVAYTFVSVAALIFFAAMMFYFARKNGDSDDD